MNKTKKIISLALAAAMTVSAAAGCGSKGSSSSNDGQGGTDKGSNASYTYNTYIPSQAVQSLNPHDWEYNDESAIQSLTQRGLYDIIYSKDAQYEFCNEMAAAAPEDVTKDYAGNDKYGVPADAESGYAFKIKLREDACWEDGTPINADTYIYSMKQMIDPQMANYRATMYTEGKYAITNAYEYYCNGQEQYVNVYDSDTQEYADVEGKDLYTSTTQVIGFFGTSLDDAATDYADYNLFTAEDGTDTLAALKELQGDNDWVKVEGDVETALNNLMASVNAGFGMEEYDGEILEFCAYKVQVEKKEWEDVGLLKDDDYTITYIFDKPMDSEYMLYYNFTTNWLVKEDIYEANKKDAAGLTKTTYGTSVDTYSSYGPYKLTGWQEDKVITLEKNDKWYGYSDSAYAGQYQTTKIVYNVIDEHATALQLFLQGNLDEIALTADDLDKYATSDYVMFTPESFTYKVSFDGDIESLKARETDGVNKSIVAYPDFRKAFSLSIDRKEFCQSVKPACSAAYGLFNDLYVYNAETFDTYRSTKQAQDVLCKVYDTENISDLTGYNVQEAAELFDKAYEEALAAGDIKDTDKIVLDFGAQTASDTMQKSLNFFQDALNAATKGTKLEGRVTIQLKQVDDPYAAMSTGSVDLIFSAWGGSEMDPYTMTQCYCDPTYYSDAEFGFDSDKDMTATIGGKEYTMSYYDWYIALCEGDWAQADTDTRLEVLAAIEGGILTEYNCVPVWDNRSASLSSMKVKYITEEFSSAYMETYGGFRFMTYEMNDEEWAEYCSSHNNQLEY
ncbi:MAG: ABC transporter substrate-binding protein [Butyrivibrio sp.]